MVKANLWPFWMMQKVNLWRWPEGAYKEEEERKTTTMSYSVTFCARARNRRVRRQFEGLRLTLVWRIMFSVTPTPSPSRQPASLTKDIDRCGYLLAKEQADKPWRKELADLKAKLQAHCETLPPGSPVHLQGSIYYLNFTARELKREVVDKPRAFAALRKKMGIDKLVEALNYPFKLLDAHLSESEQSKFVELTQTGARDVTGGLIDTPAA